MKVTRVLLFALCLLAASAAGAQNTYPPELAGAPFVLDEQGVIATLDHFDAPISLPPDLCMILQGTMESDGQTVTLHFSKAWECDWRFVDNLDLGWDFEWEADMGAYVWGDLGPNQCFKAVVYHDAGNVEFVEACLNYTGHCCPWYEFGSTGYFWVLEQSPLMMPGYVARDDTRR